MSSLPLPPWDHASLPMRRSQHSHTSTPADHVVELWQRGGWDWTKPPREAWLHVLGDVPYPTPETWATLPTLGPVDTWLADGTVTDVHLNGPGVEVMIRRSGDPVELQSGQLWNAAWFDWLVQQLRARGRGGHTDVQLSGTVNVTRPGHPTTVVRYDVALPPLCPHGPIVTLRVLRPTTWSLARLVEVQVLPASLARFLTACMRAGVNLLIAGLAGSGRTTLAQALCALAEDQRIVIVEDVSEIVLASPYVVTLTLAQVTRAAWAHVLRSTVRMNPHRIVLGDVRGAEAYDLLAAARSGYPILSTIHADSARHAMYNLVAQALEAPDTVGHLDVVHLTLKARPLIIVALERHHGRRQVAEVAEVLVERGPATPRLERLYARTTGNELQSTGAPPSAVLRQQLAAAGIVEEDMV